MASDGTGKDELDIVRGKNPISLSKGHLLRRIAKRWATTSLPEHSFSSADTIHDGKSARASYASTDVREKSSLMCLNKGML